MEDPDPERDAVGIRAALERLVLANARDQHDLAHQAVFGLSVAEHVADEKDPRPLRGVVEQEAAALAGRDGLLESRDDLPAEPCSHRRWDSVQSLDDRAVFIGLAPGDRAILGPDLLDEVIDQRSVESIFGLEHDQRKQRHTRRTPLSRGVGLRERQVAIDLAPKGRVKGRFERAFDVGDHRGRRAQMSV